MNFRSPDEFYAALDQDFAWRRKEIGTLWADANARDDVMMDYRRRAMLTMLYAHWEGFVKFGGEAYLSYVAGRRLPYQELNHSFRALSLRHELVKLSEFSIPIAHAQFINGLDRIGPSRVHIPVDGIVSTQSNLTFRVLRAILTTLGLSYTFYELKQHLIDNELLYLRNNIAHGKHHCPTRDDLKRLYDEVALMLRSLKTDFENAVALKAYHI